MTAVFGLDIGGANLKAAHSAGVACARPFALWKNPAGLTDQIRAIRDRMPPHDLLAVTMTGELCDCFGSKRDGVLSILHSTEHAASGMPIRVWTRRGAFVAPAAVREEPLLAAAANWLALAHLAAQFTEAEPGLLIDTGSTTTDIVYVEHGRPNPRGHTDRERLTSGELVYTGVRRTPVCAVLGMGVAAEFFATMLDVYLVLGLAAENAADTDTADGRPATLAGASARLARMLCADGDDVPPAELASLARQALNTQLDHVRRAISRVLAGRPTPSRIVVSGSGEVLIRQVLAGDPVLCRIPVVSLADRLGPELSAAACAYAVAVLAADR